MCKKKERRPALWLEQSGGREGGRVQVTERSLGLISNAYLAGNSRGEVKDNCTGRVNALTTAGQRSSSRISTWTEHCSSHP